MRLRRLHALLALAACAAISCAPASGQQSTISKDIEGRLFFPISRAPPISSIQITMTLEGGRQIRAYPHANTSFWVRGVPAGEHVLDAAALGFIMPSVRVDISEAGEVGASYTESPSTRLPVPIHLRAMPVDYFDKVLPFNVIAFLKSPMGMMGAFMLFAIVIMPYLKVDPEEMKEMLAERKGEKPAEPERVIAGSTQPRAALAASGAQQRGRNRR